jgi:hypothetical protein
MQAQLKNQIDFVNSKYERRIQEINNRIDDAKQSIIDKTAENEDLKNAIYTKDSREKQIYFKVRSEALIQIQQYEDEQRLKLEEMAQKSFGIDEEIFDLNNDNRIKNSEINQLMNQNQVYRLAMYAYDISEGSNITKQMLGTVALLWFGSLSIIAAVCGVMLALAGFYLRRFDGSMERELKEQVRNDIIEEAQHEAWLEQYNSNKN